MKKIIIRLNLILIPLAIIAGWSLSRASLIGKVGIHILHKDLTFLNSWWNGALFIWGIWIILEIIQSQIWKRCRRNMNLVIQGALILLTLAGLYFTYLDFRTFSHRLLGERFHIGGYLFWIGWCIISIFFLNSQKENTEIE
jgi:hypothetical protein